MIKIFIAFIFMFCLVFGQSGSNVSPNSTLCCNLLSVDGSCQIKYCTFNICPLVKQFKCHGLVQPFLLKWLWNTTECDFCF